MHLVDYMEQDLVFVLDEIKDKQSLLEALVVRVKSHIPHIDERKLLARLEERESEVSTGIGNGVAIPHTTAERLDTPLCVVAKVKGGVDFDALDGFPVKICFLLLSPTKSTGLHLRLLARVARLVMDAEFISTVADETDPSAIYQALVQKDGAHV